MIYLNKLKDYKLYKRKKIINVEKTNKARFGTVVINGNLNSFALKDLINLELFYSDYFNSYYTDKKYNTTSKNLIKTADLKNIYSDIKSSCLSIVNTRMNISSYKNRNLYFDASFQLADSDMEIKSFGIRKIRNYLNGLVLNINKVKSYKNKIIAIEVPEGLTKDVLKLSRANDSFSYFYLFFSKNNQLDDSVKNVLNNIIFLFYTSNGCMMKITMADNLDKNKLRNSLLKLLNASHTDISEVEEDEKIDEGNEESKNIKKDEFVKASTNYIQEKLGITNQERYDNNIIKKSFDTIEEKLYNKKVSNNQSEMNEKDLLDILNNDEEIKDAVNTAKETKKSGRTDEEYLNRLEEKQKEVSLDGKTVQEMFDDFKNISIEENKIENKNIISEEVKKSSLKDFDNSYEHKQLKKDVVSILTSFNKDTDVKLFLQDIKTENTSDAMNKKLTYSMSFMDDRKVKHSITMDVPIIKDGVYFMLNGGKKILLKQRFLLPIVKTKPDTVQITTNYNKYFVTRFGRKISDNVERIKKFFSQDINDFIETNKKINYKLGSCSRLNTSFKISLEYSEFSNFILFLEDSDYHIEFDQTKVNDWFNPERTNYIKKLDSISYDKNKYFVIGYKQDKSALILCDKNNSNIKIGTIDYSNISNLMIEILNHNLKSDAFKQFSSIKPSNTLTYSRVKITGRVLPLIVVLGYEKGLKTILDKYKVNYKFVESQRSPTLTLNERKIRFSNGFLIYDSSLIRNTLLLDGLSIVPTEEYTFEDMDDKFPYLEVFYESFGSRNIGKGIHNSNSLMIDSITKNVLEILSLPTDIIDVLLYANTLLETYSFRPLNDMHNYRIRGSEQMVGLMYKILADSFKTYKDTLNAGNPIKMSVPKDILIKKLLESKSVDEASILNPSLEIEKNGSSTVKGPSGLNLDSSFTTEIRAYNKTMAGILSPTTPDSNKAGVVRQLSYNPKILNTRGMIDVDSKPENNNTSLYSHVELINNFTQKHSDPR